MTQAFISDLANIAETMGSPHLTAIIDRLQRPLRVAVLGRAGVGRGCVATALRRHGVAVGSDGADVRVVVVAEDLKDEDLDIVRSSREPVLIVLTKADLAGSGPGGPVAVAARRAVAIRRRTGVPAVATVGLLAALQDPLDDDLVQALRVFVTEPPDLTSVAAIVDEPHSVDAAVRARLLALLDRFGIAHAVLALSEGCEPGGLVTHLSGVSRIGEVTVALEAVAAPVRHRRLHTALREIHCLAAQLNKLSLSELLASDAAAMAAMTVAVDVVEAAGLSVDRGDTAAAHLDRAVRWRTYGRGPVNAIHRRCSADIVRGSLRLLARGSST